MISRRIEGCTRVLGKTQGYLGLPIRDITINEVVLGAGSAAMQSAWEPTTGEMRLLKEGASIILTVMGTTHPPVMMTVNGLGKEEAVTTGKVIEAMRDYILSLQNYLPPEHQKVSKDLVTVANRYLMA